MARARIEAGSRKATTTRTSGCSFNASNAFPPILTNGSVESCAAALGVITARKNVVITNKTTGKALRPTSVMEGTPLCRGARIRAQRKGFSGCKISTGSGDRLLKFKWEQEYARPSSLSNDYSV